MDLDDLKATWAAHGAALEQNLAINQRLLRAQQVGTARRSLAPYARWRALEVVTGGLAVLAIGSVLARHPDELRYLVVGGALLAFAIAMTAACVRLLAASLRLDLAGPVASSQRALEELARTEYRVTKWALLGGVAVWLPAVLVLIEALTGAPLLGRVELAWLAANLGFGGLVFAVGQHLARRHVEQAPRAQRIVEVLSGRPLRRASAHLAELAAFERAE